MSSKPLVIVTRKLPDAIETRMMELFNVRLNNEDAPLTQAQLVEAVKAADVLVPTVTDKIDAAVLSQASDRLRLSERVARALDGVGRARRVPHLVAHRLRSRCGPPGSCPPRGSPSWSPRA